MIFSLFRNDMVRFNNDLVRRKDKVKARKADLYSNKSVLQRNSVFATNSNLSIRISVQPNGVNL